MQQVLREEFNEVSAWDSEFEHVEIRMALSSLEPQEALALQLVYWDGLKAAEAAKIVGCSTPAFWARLSRARTSFRTVFKGDSSPSEMLLPRREESAHG